MEKSLDVLDGVTVTADKKKVEAKGPKGELVREFRNPEIKIAAKDGQIVISSETDRRKAKALVGTIAAHINNMMSGVTNGWEAKMKLVYSHFPAKIEIKDNTIVIQNFLGEKKSRLLKLSPNVEVKVDKDVITITGIDKELVGQTAGSIEKLTRVTGYDRRVFQDGCYITQKPVQPGGE